MLGAYEIQHIFEKCHHEDTVIFDNGIKPHFVKVKATLGAYACLLYTSPSPQDRG